jgi:CDP-2,3-bis-(O-geranylgeranyl)-sn-glycerol synthase
MTGELWELLQALILLGVANGAAVIGTRVFGARLACPLDAGVRFFDGRPLLGAHKTVRGVLLALAATAAAAALLGLSWRTGTAIAALAMTGDALSSFIKRRLRLKEGGQALGLDQVPESLLPLLVCRAELGLDYVDVAVLVAAFFAIELALSRLLFRLHLRERPY